MSDASPQVEAPAAPSAAASVPSPPPGATPGDWRASLSEEYRSNKSLERYQDVGALAKGYVELEKRLGSGGVAVPGKDAKPEEWDAYHTKLGLRPDAHDKYELPEVPGLAIDPTLKDGFAKLAHKHGLSQAAFKEFADLQASYFLKAGDAAQAREAEQVRASERQLEQMWGPKGGPRWNQELAKANAVNRHFFNDNEGLYEAIRGEGNRNPLVVAALAAMAPHVLSSTDIERGDAVRLTGDAAREKARAIFTDKNHAFNKPGEPGHEEAKLEVQRLYEQAVGTAPVGSTAYSGR